MRKPTLIAPFVFAALLLVPSASADLVIMDDDCYVIGHILEQDGESVLIETPAGERRIPWTEVRSLRTRDTLLEEHREKHAEIGERVADSHFELATWLDKVGLPVEAQARLRAVISIDPDHEGARDRLGYVRKKDRWVFQKLEGRAAHKSLVGLPRVVRGLIALAEQDDPAGSSAGLWRLKDWIASKKEWLVRGLRDATDPDRDMVLAEIGLGPDAADRGDLQGVVDNYMADRIGAPLSEHFQMRLQDTRSKLMSNYKKVRAFLPNFRSRRGSKERGRLLRATHRAQEAALAAIESEKMIKTSVIGERTKELNKIWKLYDAKVQADLDGLLAFTPDTADKILERLRVREDAQAEIESLLSELGTPPEEVGPTLGKAIRCLLTYRAGRIDEANEMMKEGLGEWELALLLRMKNLRVMEANNAMPFGDPKSGKAPKPEELEQSIFLNRYRMMLGRGALEIDPLLTECARGHSEEMFRLGYFGHDSPVPERKTPSMRARLVGYKGPVSENIVSTGRFPAAKTAHIAWKGSIRHHRNMISKMWRCVGVGQHVGNFTQNFGTTSQVKR
ncbi:MAG: CAP domain-containing protein [Planctomycetota bacterium]|nr:CAP domain-containing protein [Planctomycetota bacterium]